MSDPIQPPSTSASTAKAADESTGIRPTGHTSETDGGPINADDIRVGYQVAAQFAVYDGQLSWQIVGTFVQFGILMVAGAVFPSFVGTTSGKIQGLAGLLVSVAGIVMSAMFGSMVMRIRTFEGYWIARAEQLEALLGTDIQTVRGSSHLSRLREVYVGNERVTMGRLFEVKSKIMLGSLFSLFFICFVGLAGLNVDRIAAGG
jgi:hypothetical protein